jgi:hypothetical protein
MVNFRIKFRGSYYEKTPEITNIKGGMVGWIWWFMPINPSYLGSRERMTGV